MPSLRDSGTLQSRREYSTAEASTVVENSQHGEGSSQSVFTANRIALIVPMSLTSPPALKCGQ